MTITKRNLDGYGAPPVEWARVKAVLDGQLTQAPGTGGPQRHTVWLTTINPDGSPHVMPVGVVHLGGAGTSPRVQRPGSRVTSPAILGASSASPPIRSTSSSRASPNASAAEPNWLPSLRLS
jgi:hypothetical protein